MGPPPVVSLSGDSHVCVKLSGFDALFNIIVMVICACIDLLTSWNKTCLYYSHIVVLDCLPNLIDFSSNATL